MRKLIAISLSCILLLSNVGLTLASHYCGGEAVESSLLLGGGDLDCGMDMSAAACENPQPPKTTFHAPPCCENHYTVLKTENLNLNSKIPVPEIPVVFFRFVSQELFATAFINKAENKLSAPDIPAIPVPDIGIFFQVFRL